MPALIGVVYITTRLLGKWLGVYAGARFSKQSREIRDWLGLCMLAQAGAAIALASIVVKRVPEIGGPIQDIILGSVVFFELIGPLFTRAALLRAGEVPFGQAIHHTSRTPLTQLQVLADRISTTVGRRQIGQSLPKSMLVATLLRKTAGIPESASFDEVIAHIEHSHDNTFPIVAANGSVVGAIRYPLLSNIMFDQTVSELIRAEDLATPSEGVLYPDEPGPIGPLRCFKP